MIEIRLYVSVKYQSNQFSALFLSNSNGESTELIINQGCLYISEYFGYFKEIFKNTNETFSHVKEAELISVLQDLKVGSWKSEYTFDEIWDGVEWELELKINHENHNHYFNGFEAVSNNNSYSKKYIYSSEFRKLLNTFNKLLGKRKF